PEGDARGGELVDVAADGPGGYVGVDGERLLAGALDGCEHERDGLAGVLEQGGGEAVVGFPVLDVVQLPGPRWRGAARGRCVGGEPLPGDLAGRGGDGDGGDVRLVLVGGALADGEEHVLEDERLDVDGGHDGCSLCWVGLAKMSRVMVTVQETRHP